MTLSTEIGHAPAQPATLPTSRPLELQDILRLPFASELVAAPTPARVAWVFNEGGSRNVWLACAGAGPSEVARRLTRYGDDDGMELGHLRWTHAGDGVVYARGTVLSDDAPPNPSSSAETPTGPELWLANLHGTSTPRRLGSGHSAEVSPVDGDIAWIHQGQIWHTSAPDQGEAVQLFRDRGRCRGLQWSPDGRQLAFVSERGDHSFVGVYEKASRTVRWMEPGVYRDTSPTWSPDGHQIAFIRLSDSAAETYTARREGPPWSIWSTDVLTGAGRCIWRAPSGAGSVFRPLAFGPQLIWTAAGGIVFPWEGSGWLHLHMTAPGSADTVELTPGDYEVASMTADRAAKVLICTANKDQVDGSRLWRLELGTGAMAALTSAHVMAWGAVVTDGGEIVGLQADARSPLQPVWIDRAGASRALATDAYPTDFPYQQLVQPQHVAFRSPDGQEIHAQLFAPPDAQDASLRPAIVHFHGGPMRQMFAAWHHTDCYHLQYGLNQYLASRGYLVMSVNYRGGTGYGLEFREALGLGPAGASEYLDALGAAHFLSARPDVDKKRIGAYGVSYGGLMTALALGCGSGLYAAGVDCAGIANWRAAFPGAPADVLDRATASSPIGAIDDWTAPVLFVHADDDRTVPFSQTVELVRALEQKDGANVECIVLPDEQHDFLRRASWERLFDATTNFFHRTIGPAAAFADPEFEGTQT